jgi:predicted transcriptional regulator
MTQESVRIDSELVKQLREYNAKTGVPISKVIEEAVSQWLICTAPVRLEALGQEPLSGLAELEAKYRKNRKKAGREFIKQVNGA